MSEDYTKTIIGRIVTDLQELQTNSDRWMLLYQSLAARYDDAMKRINDMQAELEHLRREVHRG